MYFLEDAVRLSPQLEHGGIEWKELVLMARRWAVQTAASRDFPFGLDVVVDCRPWPFPANVQRVGNRVTIFVDSRRDAFAQRWNLAHEIGHLVIGHYDLSQPGETWFQSDTPGNCEWEMEADFFASFCVRSPGIPAAWFFTR